MCQLTGWQSSQQNTNFNKLLLFLIPPLLLLLLLVLVWSSLLSFVHLGTLGIKVLPPDGKPGKLRDRQIGWNQIELGRLLGTKKWYHGDDKGVWMSHCRACRNKLYVFPFWNIQQRPCPPKSRNWFIQSDSEPLVFLQKIPRRNFSGSWTLMVAAYLIFKDQLLLRKITS